MRMRADARRSCSRLMRIAMRMMRGEIQVMRTQIAVMRAAGVTRREGNFVM
jgi:hypothetical protein